MKGGISPPYPFASGFYQSYNPKRAFALVAKTISFSGVCEFEVANDLYCLLEAAYLMRIVAPTMNWVTPRVSMANRTVLGLNKTQS